MTRQGLTITKAYYYLREFLYLYLSFLKTISNTHQSSDSIVVVAKAADKHLVAVVVAAAEATDEHVGRQDKNLRRTKFLPSQRL